MCQVLPWTLRLSLRVLALVLHAFQLCCLWPHTAHQVLLFTPIVPSCSPNSQPHSALEFPAVGFGNSLPDPALAGLSCS